MLSQRKRERSKSLLVERKHKEAEENAETENAEAENADEISQEEKLRSRFKLYDQYLDKASFDNPSSPSLPNLPDDEISQNTDWDSWDDIHVTKVILPSTVSPLAQTSNEKGTLKSKTWLGRTSNELSFSNSTTESQRTSKEDDGDDDGYILSVSVKDDQGQIKEAHFDEDESSDDDQGYILSVFVKDGQDQRPTPKHSPNESSDSDDDEVDLNYILSVTVQDPKKAGELSSPLQSPGVVATTEPRKVSSRETDSISNGTEKPSRHKTPSSTRDHVDSKILKPSISTTSFFFSESPIKKTKEPTRVPPLSFLPSTADRQTPPSLTRSPPPPGIQQGSSSYSFPRPIKSTSRSPTPPTGSTRVLKSARRSPSPFGSGIKSPRLAQEIRSKILRSPSSSFPVRSPSPKSRKARGTSPCLRSNRSKSPHLTQETGSQVIQPQSTILSSLTFPDNSFSAPLDSSSPPSSSQSPPPILALSQPSSPSPSPSITTPSPSIKTPSPSIKTPSPSVATPTFSSSPTSSHSPHSSPLIFPEESENKNKAKQKNKKKKKKLRPKTVEEVKLKTRSRTRSKEAIQAQAIQYPVVDFEFYKDPTLSSTVGMSFYPLAQPDLVVNKHIAEKRKSTKKKIKKKRSQTQTKENQAPDSLSQWNTRFQSCLARIDKLWQGHSTGKGEDGRSKYAPRHMMLGPSQMQSEERMQANIELMHLSEDFVYASRAVGKVIISEVYLPFDEKTIKPKTVGLGNCLSFFKRATRSREGEKKIQNRPPFNFIVPLGGRAGGEKYIVHNILFKFALDSFDLYGGSDLAAAKGFLFK